MSSGTNRPPVAPKPRLTPNQKAALSPQVPRKETLSVLSPGMTRKVKPPVAPKPCHSKPAAAVSNPLISKIQQHKSVPETPRTVGLLNSHNGIQHIKKPDWDYIIPICLCNQKNCTCVKAKNSETKVKNLQKHNKTEENGNAVVLSSGKLDNGGRKTGNLKFPVANASSTNVHDFNHQLLHEGLNVENPLSADSDPISSQGIVGPSVRYRAWSDVTNSHIKQQGVTGRRQDDEGFGPERTDVLQHKPALGPFRKAPPVPVPRKLRTAVTPHQEKVERETAIKEKREMTVEEVKMPSDGKGSSSLSVSVADSENNQPVFLSARRAILPPSRMPRTMPYLFDTTKTPTSSVQTPSGDLQEDYLSADKKHYEMKKSVHKKDEEMKKKVADQKEKLHLPSMPLSQPELSKPLIVSPAADDSWTVKESMKKHHRHNSSFTFQTTESIEEEDDHDPSRAYNLHSGALKEMMRTRELPVPPTETLTRNIKHSGTSLNKKKAKSFSSADNVRSNVQKGNSFRKILELKLGKKTAPKMMETEEQNPYSTTDDWKGSVDNDQYIYQLLPKHYGLKQKLPSTLTEVEQSVDGDEFLEEGGNYDNTGIYEEISDYENVVVGKADASQLDTHTTARQSCLQDDEGIYEVQEPYFSLVKDAHQDPSPTEYDRSSVDEEVEALNDTFSDDDITFNTSDEENEDESSSISSKDEPVQPEEDVQNRKKKSKIQHIATEIMSSESVFVDVLKLLHVDFRGSVEKASHQNGKPVIEERLLNQILYYLPQLYELNKDLLRELTLRVANWNEDSQIADIFLNKGPYLKMYSTYIREFDKNVALLEEQTKKNSAFGVVVKEFEFSPRCANLALKHYLLKPVQRIPQYQLLLTDYLKNLSEDSVDYKDTQAALALVKEVANHANDIMKHGDNFEKLVQVQSRLSGHQHEIVQPGRIFLKEGVLMKLSRKVMQPRMFFLFNDVLLYTMPVQSGQYKLKNMLSLAGMKVSKPSLEAYQNELNIESVERSFILSASSASERDEWLETISSAINEYTKKKISFISGKTPDEEQSGNNDGGPLGSKAPIWIPDLRTTMCMICTCDFTLTWRRHHCRACGKVVCQACSSNKYCLEYKHYQLSRVCDQCFVILQKQKSETTAPGVATIGSKATFGFRKQKKIPAALKEVSANTDDSSMSGYLTRSKNGKKGKRLWFVIKDKVLYTYAASEDVAALESQPLLGFVLKADPLHKLQFKLLHQNTLYYFYKADNVQIAQRWINKFKEATVL